MMDSDIPIDAKQRLIIEISVKWQKVGAIKTRTTNFKS